MIQLDSVKHLGVVGTGLLGASLGLALKQRGFAGRITGIGRRQATLDQAKHIGAIDESSTDLTAVLPDVQLLVIAVPLSGFEAVFQTIAGHEHEQLVITDVGSTKLSVQQAAERWLEQPQRFVGAHPMAGSEQQGPEAAEADLFEGKPCIICDTPQSEAKAVALVESLFAQVGMNLLNMTPTQHDRQVAVTSHLPHAVGAALVETAVQLGGWDVASTGFAGATRLASSNPAMRRDIMLANHQAIIEAIDTMQQNLQTLRASLDDADGQAIEQWLMQCKQAREDWLEQKSK